jgi:hypothetical protein
MEAAADGVAVRLKAWAGPPLLQVSAKASYADVSQAMAGGSRPGSPRAPMVGLPSRRCAGVLPRPALASPRSPSRRCGVHYLLGAALTRAP